MTAWIPDDAAVSPHLLNFRHSWEGFIDSLLREWKTQNVVSALMLSAILTMLQIDAAASDPIARTTALLSLISALMSLLFGSMYIIRFGTMRKMYKAANWADVRRVSPFASSVVESETPLHRKRKKRKHPSCGMCGSCSPYQLFGLPGELSCYIAG
ncbi:hypothetical protein C8R44DRAFT_602986 [Mycena epipterygia]|nr:hypothetical protein C8R44DRAFT_602986 [Mycena epipterygia]